MAADLIIDPTYNYPKLYDANMSKTNTFVQGEIFTFVYAVKNIGTTATASDYCQSAMYIDNYYNPVIAYDDVIHDGIQLGVDERIYFSHTYDTSSLTEGTYTLYFNADYYNSVSNEINETNNMGSVVFTITAPPHINQAPIVNTTIPNQSTTEGEAFSFSIPGDTFSDPDGDALTYSINNKPDWLSFDTNTNTFSGTALLDSPDATITIIASDPSNASASTTLTINTITPAPVNNPHTGTIAINDTTPQVNQTVTAISTLNDADGLGTLNYQWLVNDVPVGSNANNYTVTAGDLGKAIKVTASFTDGKGFAETASSDNTNVVTSIDQTINGKDNVNDVLSGGVGNDTIDGLSGADVMVGNTGNDTYRVDNLGDVVIETSTLATEIDTVYSSVDYTLPNNVENLTLAGTSTAKIGNGNYLKNILLGNDLANTLDGKRGADIMDGGDGNDIYVVDNTLDVVIEQYSNVQGGNDLVRSYVSFTLGDNLENLTLLGTTKINATGNALNNALTGNSAANRLSGNAGADKLLGGAGNDTLIGGLGKDTLTGGLGADVFKYTKVSDSTITSRDTITDFKTAQKDKIDLSAIDANTVAAGNNAFTSLSVDGAFSGTFAQRGDLYFDSVNHILYGNNDVDSAADFSIQLSGVVTLSKANFVL